MHHLDLHSWNGRRAKEENTIDKFDSQRQETYTELVAGYIMA